jgi:O-antigen/teichoic acid export membrane protein
MERSTKHILSHVGYYLLARGLPGMIAFLAIPLFSRLLAPAEYGRYALAVATVSLANALLFQWLRLSLVRYLPAYRWNEARLKSTLLTVTLGLLGVLGGVTAIACVLPVAAEWRVVAVVCWALLAAQATFEQCCEYTRAALRPRRYMVLQFTRSAFAVGLGVALVKAGAGWWGPIVGAMAGWGLATAWAYRRDWRDARLRIDPEALRQARRYGVPLSLTIGLAMVIADSDRFLIAWFRGADAAGLYAVAVDFTSQTLTLLMMTVYMAVFPMAVRAWEARDLDATRGQMGVNCSLLLAVGVPCVLGLAVLAPGIAECFLGGQFHESAGRLIPIVAAGAFLAGLKAYHFDAAFQFADRTLQQVWIVLLAAGLNVALNLLAIPRWGLAGAAWASAATYLLTLGLTIGLGRRHLRLPFAAGDCGRVLLAGAVMAVALYPLRGYRGAYALAGQVAGGAAVYGVILLGTNFLGLRRALWARWKRTDGEIAGGVCVLGVPGVTSR